MIQLDILLNVESRILSQLFLFFFDVYCLNRNYPTVDNVNKKMKSDEERQERGDVLETRQFGLVIIL